MQALNLEIRCVGEERRGKRGKSEREGAREEERERREEGKRGSRILIYHLYFVSIGSSSVLLKWNHTRGHIQENSRGN